jgi:hypothetical protein
MSAWFLSILALVIGVVDPACLLTTRVGPIVPFAFIAAYVLALGAISFVIIGVFGMVDVMFRAAWVSAWLELDWPLWTILFAPSAISALLACWFSRPSVRRDAAMLLGVYLLLILAAMGAVGVLAHVGIRGPWFLVGGLALLSSIFFAMALVKRAAQGHEVLSDP